MKYSPRALGGTTLALVSLLVACGPSQEDVPPPPPRSLPLRVVSLSPAASEFVLALGAASTLIAVDGESWRLPRLTHLPIVELDGAVDLHPDLVLVPALRREDQPLAEQLRAHGGQVIEVAPHDFDDVFALCRSLGTRLVGYARATVFENTMARELASTSGSFYGRPRPRIAAVIGVEPLVVAGGHSFTTDLIELAGGSSVTHALEEPKTPMSVAQLIATAPDLLLVVSASALSEREQEAVRLELRDAPRLGFFVFDADRFWVRDGIDAVRRLRALVEPLSRDMERSRSRLPRISRSQNASSSCTTPLG